MADVIHFIKPAQPVNYSAVTGPLIQETNLGSDTSGTIGGTFNPLYDGRFAEQYAYLTVSGDFYTINGRPIAMSGDTVASGPVNADTLDGQHGYYYRDRANHSGTSATATITTLTSTTANITTVNATTVSYNRAWAYRDNVGFRSGTYNIDWSIGQKAVSLSGNTTFTFTSPGSTARLQVELTQDGVGSRTVTWPATVKWPGGVAPTLTTTPSGVDIIAFWYNGTNYLGTSALDFR